MKIRTALLITSVFVLFSFLTPVLTSSAVTHHKRSSLTIVYRQDEPTILHVERARLVAYATAVTANQVTIYSAAVVAAQQAATVPSAPPVSPSVASNPAPVSVAPSSSNSTIWACIIQHESNGDPTVVNSSSGASGLFQFETPTWLSNGGGQYAPTAGQATVAQQWSIAVATQASDGWSPWRGDGCTPVG